MPQRSRPGNTSARKELEGFPQSRRWYTGASLRDCSSTWSALVFRLARSGCQSGRGHHGVFADAVLEMLESDMAAGLTCDPLDTVIEGDRGFEMRTVLPCPAASSRLAHSMTPFDVSIASSSSCISFDLGAIPNNPQVTSQQGPRTKPGPSRQHSYVTPEGLAPARRLEMAPKSNTLRCRY